MLTCNEADETNYALKAYSYHSNPTGRFPGYDYKKEYSFRILFSHSKNIEPDSIEVRFNKLACERYQKTTGETPYIYTYNNGFREKSVTLLEANGNSYTMITARIPNNLNPTSLDEKVLVSFKVKGKRVEQYVSFEELPISVTR